MAMTLTSQGQLGFDHGPICTRVPGQYEVVAAEGLKTMTHQIYMCRCFDCNRTTRRLGGNRHECPACGSIESEPVDPDSIPRGRKGEQATHEPPMSARNSRRP